MLVVITEIILQQIYKTALVLITKIIS